MYKYTSLKLSHMMVNIMVSSSQLASDHNFHNLFAIRVTTTL